MTTPNPSNWQTTARGLATTVLLVAIALYIAVRLIEAVAGLVVGNPLGLGKFDYSS